MREDLDAGRVVVVAGFQGMDEQGHITTLGRAARTQRPLPLQRR